VLKRLVRRIERHVRRCGLLGTHQGAVRPHHLDAYLDEFVFRYNRRSSGRVTLPVQRLCAIPVLTPPVTYRRIVDEAQLVGAA